jgi:hypothetical protein
VSEGVKPDFLNVKGNLTGLLASVEQKYCHLWKRNSGAE